MPECAYTRDGEEGNTVPRCNLMYVQETLVHTLSLELRPSRSWAVTPYSAMLWHVAPFLQSLFLGETEHLPCTHSMAVTLRQTAVAPVPQLRRALVPGAFHALHL